MKLSSDFCCPLSDGAAGGCSERAFLLPACKEATQPLTSLAGTVQETSSNHGVLPYGCKRKHKDDELVNSV